MINSLPLLLADADTTTKGLILIGIITLFVVAAFLVVGVIVFKGKERTKREIMQQVAEGKLSIEDAERLINAGKTKL